MNDGALLAVLILAGCVAVADIVCAGNSAVEILMRQMSGLMRLPMLSAEDGQRMAKENAEAAQRQLAWLTASHGQSALNEGEKGGGG